TGASSGGLGSDSPGEAARGELRERLRREVLEPAIAALAEQRTPFQGVLDAGWMLATDGTLSVLEFNCRFGDPETQALLPALPGMTRHLADIAAGSWTPVERTLVA